MKSTKRNVKILTNLLGEIFDSVNKSICSDCPRATEQVYPEVNPAYYIDRKALGFIRRYWKFSKDIVTVKEANYIGRLYSKEAGCCSMCAGQHGYLGCYDGANLSIKYKELQKKYKFTKTYGFFDNKNKICKLPREERSITCLHFTCDSVQNKIGEKNCERVKKIVRGIRNNRMEEK